MDGAFQEVAAPDAPPAARIVLANGLLLLLALAGLVTLIRLGLRWRRAPLPPADERARDSWLARRPWTDAALGFFPALLLLGHACAGLLLLAHPSDFPPGALTPGVFAVQSALFHGLILIAALLLPSLRGGAPLTEALGWHGADFRGAARRAVTYYLAALPLFFAYTLLWQTLLRYFGVTPEPQPVVDVMLSPRDLPTRLYLLTTAILVAPLAEEIFFRGVLLPALARRLGALGGLVVVSLIFAAVHRHTAAFVPLFIISLAFGLGYRATRSFWTPFLMHGLFNSVSLVFTHLTRS